MSLSKINETPVYVTNLPSTGEKIKYRPFLVKEERALLTANESEDVNTMFASLEAVVRNCITPSSLRLTTFDIEYLFVQIRSKSVGETSDVIIPCDKCSEDNEVSIDLKSCSVVTPPEHTLKLVLSDSIVLVMKHPSMDELLDIQNAKNDEEAITQTIRSCVDTVVHNDDIYVIKEESNAEVKGFIDNLNHNQYELLKGFVRSIPFTQIKHNWVCKKCEHKNESVLTGIFSFF